MSDDAESPLSTQPLAYLDEAPWKPVAPRQPDFAAAEEGSPEADGNARKAFEQKERDRVRALADARILSRAAKPRAPLNAEKVARARARRAEDRPTASGQCGKCSAPDAAFSMPHTDCSHRVLCSTCHGQLNPICARDRAYAEEMRTWMCTACAEA